MLDPQTMFSLVTWSETNIQQFIVYVLIIQVTYVQAYICQHFTELVNCTELYSRWKTPLTIQQDGLLSSSDPIVKTLFQIVILSGDEL